MFGNEGEGLLHACISSCIFQIVVFGSRRSRFKVGYRRCDLSGRILRLFSTNRKTQLASSVRMLSNTLMDESSRSELAM